MRVLEPHQLKHLQTVKKLDRRRKLPVLFVVLLGAAVIGYIAFGQNLIHRSSPKLEQSSESQRESPDKQPRPKVLKVFTSQEFKKLYSSYVYPNTQPITVPPEITGNAEVDAHIRALAVKRGYKLTALPVASIVKTGEPGLEGDDLMQPNALQAWQQMKAAAANEHIPLTMTSAYRSIDYQRGLFLRRMQDAGVNVYTIAEGFADDELDMVLSRAALPGYSRHHTGYTMDLSCNGVGLEAFIHTACYTWLSKNNFENTKKFGWIPSYPEGATQLGPEPEPWEFIWVGTASLYE